jgi:hypothetical protein
MSNETKTNVIANKSADEAHECEFHTHELKSWMGRFHLSAVPGTGREGGYDPYNNSPPTNPPS